MGPSWWPCRRLAEEILVRPRTARRLTWEGYTRELWGNMITSWNLPELTVEPPILLRKRIEVKFTGMDYSIGLLIAC